MMLSDGSAAIVIDTVVVANSARDGSWTSAGGGIYVRSSSSLDVVRSSLRSNSAIFGLEARGGAIVIARNSRGDIRGTELLGNTASDGGAQTLGGALYVVVNSSVQLVNATVCGNVAERAPVVGGGFCYLEDDSSLAVSDSRLCNNSALAGAQQSRGGVLSASGPVKVRLERTSLLDNHASSNHSGASTLGGALYAAAAPSTIDIAGCEVGRNGATSNGGLAAGGALHVGQQVVVRINDTEVSENRAKGGKAEGGAIWFAGETLDLTNAPLTRNVASADGGGTAERWAALSFTRGLRRGSSTATSSRTGP